VSGIASDTEEDGFDKTHLGELCNALLVARSVGSLKEYSCPCGHTRMKRGNVYRHMVGTVPGAPCKAIKQLLSKPRDDAAEGELRLALEDHRKLLSAAYAKIAALEADNRELKKRKPNITNNITNNITVNITPFQRVESDGDVERIRNFNMPSAEELAKILHGRNVASRLHQIVPEWIMLKYFDATPLNVCVTDNGKKRKLRVVQEGLDKACKWTNAPESTLCDLLEEGIDDFELMADTDPQLDVWDDWRRRSITGRRRCWWRVDHHVRQEAFA